MYLINNKPGELYMAVISWVLELNLCIAILSALTDFILRYGFRKNKGRLYPTLSWFHHQEKVDQFENTSGSVLCLVLIYSDIKLDQTWPGFVTKWAGTVKKKKRKAHFLHETGICEVPLLLRYYLLWATPAFSVVWPDPTHIHPSVNKVWGWKEKEM